MYCAGATMFSTDLLIPGATDMFKMKAYINIKVRQWPWLNSLILSLCCCVVKVYFLFCLPFPYITAFLKVYLCCCVLNFHIFAKTDGSKLGSFEAIHTCLHGRSGRVHGFVRGKYPEESKIKCPCRRCVNQVLQHQQ
jgi:hypothetical protein